MAYFILAAFFVLLDQALKFWVVENIPLYQSMEFLPPLMNLTYVQNTGAAFSLFSNHTWALTIISSVMSFLIALALATKFFSRPLGRLSLSLVLAGAVGNLIDRAFRGFVVDMFNFMFIRFAVFNIADVCVVIGGFGMAVYYLFFYEKYDAPPPPETKLDHTSETPDPSTTTQEDPS